jgi:hypothetical protein
MSVLMTSWSHGQLRHPAGTVRAPLRSLLALPREGPAQPAQAITAALPQIGIRDGIEVIEIDEVIRSTVPHCERDRTAFHDLSIPIPPSVTRAPVPLRPPSLSIRRPER